MCTHNTPAVSTEWNALTAKIITQAADATIRSLRRGDIAGLRALVSLIRRRVHLNEIICETFKRSNATI